MLTHINRFYFVRHGQTWANKSQVFHADESIGLTDLGHQQAQRASAALSTLSISAIASSTYPRVQATIAPLLEIRPHLANSQHADLVERSFAALDGRRFEDVVGETASDASWAKFWFQVHEGVETEPDFRARVRRGLETALVQDDILIAAHGGVLVSVIDNLGITRQSGVHGNAHPIKFERSTSGDWGLQTWCWDTSSFVDVSANAPVNIGG